MRIVTGDLWDHGIYRVVPTNLWLRTDGLSVMGRGVAAQAVARYPTLQQDYGKWLVHRKAVFNVLADERCESCGFEDSVRRPPPLENPRHHVYLARLYDVLCVPVKKHWRDQADLKLIERGVQALAELVDRYQVQEEVALPLLGCGFGERTAEEVLPLLKYHLVSEQFTLVLRDEAATTRHAHTLRPGARRDRS